MIQQLTLTDLREGQFGKVTNILASGSMRRRLLDLGVIEGTSIQCLQKSPCGDPIAFLIRGAAIALRTEDSCDIVIEMVS